ncbi:MAG: hypothetical protein CVV03_06015 [Firmicutes bacterium HGW-Firmicutes-8]|nr:MAG: hypothetical protein CVV03_06015 [Firmicutes bacterium HGW-Firmicutes-8]
MNKIDILIPVIEKDLEVLSYVIDSARKHIRHPLGEIFVVAPESCKIRKLSSEKNCKFINENSVLPITKKDIVYSPKKRNTYIDRSGWLFQQFLKLSGDTLSMNEGFLVLDADTVLIRPHVFERDKKSVLFFRSLYYKPYFETYKRLLGEDAAGPAQHIFFVSHYMYFKKKRLQELKKRIEFKHQTDWYTAVLNSMNKNQWDSFSEFETYGNFMMKNHLSEIILKPRQNLSLTRNRLKDISKIEKKLANKYKIRSVSFHDWKK